MSRALFRYRHGVTVDATCFNDSCDKVIFSTTLGYETPLASTFLGNGRFHWRPGTRVLGFNLAKSVQCPQCKRYLSLIVVVSNGYGKQPTIFGHEGEPI